MSHPITSERFCDMHIYAPVGMQEQLWCYLYNEGLIKVPLQWHLDLTMQRIGLAFLPVFDSVVRTLSNILLVDKAL